MEKSQSVAEKQRELQRIFIESESYRKQLEELSARLQFSEQRRLELSSAVELISSLEEAGKGVEVLVPIGGDAFIKAEVKEADKVLVGVGAGVSLEKDSGSAKKLLEDKIKNLDSAVEKMQKAFSEVNLQLARMESESKKLIAEIQQQKI